MKCLRSGWCCHHLDVIIVDDPEKGIKDGNLIHKPYGQRCKHLGGKNPGEFFCKIHNKKWFKETPCHAYDQIGAVDAPCRTGKHMIDKMAKSGKAPYIY